MGKPQGSDARSHYDKHPFQLPLEELKSTFGLNTDTGLSSSQVSEQRNKFGENKLAGQGGVKWYEVLLKQCSNAMILVSTLDFDSYWWR